MREMRGEMNEMVKTLSFQTERVTDFENKLMIITKENKDLKAELEMRRKK